MSDVREPGRVTFLIEQARETALREARDAVKSLRSGSRGADYEGVEIDLADALAAIDALREVSE